MAQLSHSKLYLFKTYNQQSKLNLYRAIITYQYIDDGLQYLFLVNKVISINPSPNVSYRFAKAGPKHYLCLQGKKAS